MTVQVDFDKNIIRLNVEICLAFDSGISEQYIINCCNKFKHIRNTSYIFDKDMLLEDKMSPVDKKRKTFDYLFKNRTYVQHKNEVETCLTEAYVT